MHWLIHEVGQNERERAVALLCVIFLEITYSVFWKSFQVSLSSSFAPIPCFVLQIFSAFVQWKWGEGKEIEGTRWWCTITSSCKYILSSRCLWQNCVVLRGGNRRRTERNEGYFAIPKRTEFNFSIFMRQRDSINIPHCELCIWLTTWRRAFSVKRRRTYLGIFQFIKERNIGKKCNIRSI